ncbi:MAG: DNA/RNA nuclease SfsA [Candidatus Caldarchaeum sp.]|nr:DNA/RNA nuclease SfsA [Candidatus Caldarchaeum sp.]
MSLLTSGRALYHLGLSKASFVTRVNRFVCEVERGGVRFLLHLTNTGRLKDLLTDGAEILYRPGSRGKTKGVLVGVVLGGFAAIIDTREQSRAFEAAFSQGLVPWLSKFNSFKREVIFEKYKIDYEFVGDGESAFVELKSAVFLREDGAAMYPDTVSTRGRSHIEALARAVETRPSYVVFVSAHPEARFFTPCDEADPLIRQLLKLAVDKGVVVKAVKAALNLDGWVVWMNSELPVLLD